MGSITIYDDDLCKKQFAKLKEDLVGINATKKNVERNTAMRCLSFTGYKKNTDDVNVGTYYTLSSARQRKEYESMLADVKNLAPDDPEIKRRIDDLPIFYVYGDGYEDIRPIVDELYPPDTYSRMKGGFFLDIYIGS